MPRAGQASGTEREEYVLLGKPNNGRNDNYEGGVKAILDAVRPLVFPYSDED